MTKVVSRFSRFLFLRAFCPLVIYKGMLPCFFGCQTHSFFLVGCWIDVLNHLTSFVDLQLYKVIPLTTA